VILIKELQSNLLSSGWNYCSQGTAFATTIWGQNSEVRRSMSLTRS